VDYKMISADDHIDLGYLPSDLWQKRLPHSLKERGPQVIEKDGGDFWVCDGEIWGDWRGGAWWSKQKPKGSIYAQDRGGVAEDYVLRPTIPELRLQDMDRDNVEATMMFGPILPMKVADLELRKAVIRGYNDWLIEFCSAAPDRFLGAGMLATEDPVTASDEVLRLAKDGRIKQVNYLVGSVTPEMVSDEAWDSFWSTAEDTGMIVSFHVGGGQGGGAGAAQRRPGAIRLGLGEGHLQFVQPFLGLFSFGVLERHPKIKFVLAESGTGWVPHFIQELDYRYNKVLERGRENAPLKEMPSEVFRRQVWATYQQDRVGLALVDFFGEGHMMWASDYPHPDSTWPNSQRIVESETANLAPGQKKAILRDNAAALYGLS
jgi:predicted TIM-barrel fold metal-dependent hydrolase